MAPPTAIAIAIAAIADSSVTAVPERRARSRLPDALLAYLRRHTGEVLTRDQLANEVWGMNHFPASRTVDVTVAALRRRLPPNERIVTLHRAGYRHEFLASS